MELFDIHFFEENYKNGQCCFEVGNTTISMFEWDDCYSIQTEQASPSMICSLKRYFVDTLGLKEEGCYLKWGHTKIGVWKKNNCEGDIIEEIDYDKGWNITWEKLIPFILAQGIKLGGIVDIFRFENKDNERKDDLEFTNERVWAIGQITKSDDEIIYYFDGDNGKLIEKTIRSLVNQ